MSQVHRPLVDQLKTLESLQELDLKIDRLNRDRQGIPVQLKVMDDGIQKAEAQANQKKAAITEAEKNRTQIKAAIDLNQDRLGRSQTKVDQIKTTQEYNAATKEVEQLNKMNEQLNTQIKKIEEEMARATSDWEASEKLVADAKAARETKAQELGGHGANLETELGKLMTERSGFTPQIEGRILSQYDRVRKARAGLGIAPATGGRCKACNMLVAPQMYNELQKGKELHACPSCHRILYVAN